MELTTRDRTELKSYFVKNAIPTESNFSDFVDAVLNQKDDGIVKPPGNPLSIEEPLENTDAPGVRLSSPGLMTPWH